MNPESQSPALVIPLPQAILSTNVAELRVSLAAQLAGNPACSAVEIDLAGCPTIDSSGLNLLASVYRECVQRQIPFRVTNPSRDIHSLLTFLKLTERFGPPPAPGKQ